MAISTEKLIQEQTEKKDASVQSLAGKLAAKVEAKLTILPSQVTKKAGNYFPELVRDAGDISKLNPGQECLRLCENEAFFYTFENVKKGTTIGKYRQSSAVIVAEVITEEKDGNCEIFEVDDLYQMLTVINNEGIGGYAARPNYTVSQLLDRCSAISGKSIKIFHNKEAEADCIQAVKRVPHGWENDPKRVEEKRLTAVKPATQTN